ncbi:Metallophosphoesterase [Candidatus Sulfopaludibacter sp. SbA6]|nr:Metallophosphoesterase [Candidatus Sulfopaludibacter sp. SbA6]
MNPLDRILSVIFFFTQWRITALWLRMARLKWKERVGPRAAVYVFDAVLVAGCICSYSNLVVRLKVPGRLAAWLGGAVLCYLMAATVVLAVYTVLAAVRKRWATDMDPGRRRVLNVAGGALMAAPFAAIGYGTLVQRTDFRVREIDVPLPGLPPDLDGFRLLQLSDIHLSPFLSEGELARVIDAARELRPHLAVMTGDLISMPGDPLDACIRQLARLKSDAGIFACMGNHERFAGVERYTAETGARAGIRFLRSQCEQLGFGTAVLNLAGVDYQPLSEKQKYLRGAERMVAPGAFNVLLSHNPDVFPLAAQQGYNLVLAGHTHGGQVTIEILRQGINPARFFTPFVYGLYRAGAAAEYVTRGIGTIGVPARIGAPPEISVLRLRKA